jgi:hypothetical protein
LNLPEHPLLKVESRDRLIADDGHDRVERGRASRPGRPGRLLRRERTRGDDQK